jgi:aminoglycoside 3-N-acetyltransferase
MYNTGTLRHDLAAMNIDPKGILMVHISYKSVGEVQGRGDAVLDALSEYMRDGLLLLPAHTWANIKREEDSARIENPGRKGEFFDTSPVMDVRTTQTCVGVLPELFRSRPSVTRSLHPTHSVCGLGKDAEHFLQGDHLAETPCGPKTCYWRMYEQRAQILLVGVRFNRNTFIHCVEEMYDLPGRLSDFRHPLWVIDYGGEKRYTPQYRHCYPELSAPFTWENEMISAGAVTEVKFGDADCLLCDARAMADEMGNILTKC